MASQQPQPEKIPLKQKVEAVKFLAQCACLPVLAVTRFDLGYRILNPLHLICTTLALLVISGLIQDQAKRPIDLAVFAVVSFVLAFCQKFVRWRQIGKGNHEHSYYIGTSCFQFRWLPKFMKRNRRMARFIDPAVCFCIGLVIFQVSYALGLWIMVASLCLRYFEYQTWRQWLNMNLDMADGTVYAGLQSDTVEQFTAPDAQNRQQQNQAGDLATGLGDDIQGKIKSRVKKQTTTASVVIPATGLKKPRRQQIILVFIIAIYADVLQLPYHGTTVAGWYVTQSQWCNPIMDVVTAACVIRLLGFRWIILLAFLLELIPGVASLPFWTACVAYLVWRPAKAPAKTPPPPRPEPEIHEVAMTKETPPPPPAPTQKAVLSDLEIEPEAVQPETAVEKRLHLLADLLNRQIITQAEHDARRQEILSKI